MSQVSQPWERAAVKKWTVFIGGHAREGAVDLSGGGGYRLLKALVGAGVVIAVRSEGNDGSSPLGCGAQVVAWRYLLVCRTSSVWRAGFYNTIRHSIVPEKYICRSRPPLGVWR